MLCVLCCIVLCLFVGLWWCRVASVHVICSKYSFRFVLLSCITCGFVTESWFPFLVLFAWCCRAVCCYMFCFVFVCSLSEQKQ